MQQTVILAAGNGSRIGSRQNGLPKPLVQVAGQALIERTLNQAESAGCEEAVVVLGNGADRVREHLEALDTPLRLTLVQSHAPDGPNGFSLLAAEKHTRDRFFLQMVDHVFAEPVLSRLTNGGQPATEDMRLLVDHSPAHLDEVDATKVRIEQGRIVAIGKRVRPWDAIDAGYFLLDRRIFGALRAASPGESLSVSAGMRRVACEGALSPVALEGVPWVDVDTPKDWEQAEDILGSPTPSSA
jgi:CDP-L-myo-inositol myo-inositolphosphotransferase